MSYAEWTPLVAVAGGLGLFGIGLGLSKLLVRWVERRASRWGLVDEPGERKVHQVTTPLGGGIAVYVATAVPIVAGLAIVCGIHAARPEWLLSRLPEAWTVHLPGIVESAPLVLGMLVAGGAVFAVGLVDDLRGLGPRPKLAVEIAVAAVLALAGVRATLFVENPLFGGAVSILWIVLITNSFNLLDNMDGLSSGVAFVAGIVFFWVAVQTGQWFVASYLVVFLGALAGFLTANFPPARIFLGDAGSLFIGFQLATLTLVSTFYEPRYPVFPVALPLLVLAVPLFDTASVVWIRWREGRPIMVGDRRHLSHRLVESGMGPKEAVLAIYLLTLTTGLGALVLYHTNARGAGFLLAQLVAVLALVGLLERAGRRKTA